MRGIQEISLQARVFLRFFAATIFLLDRWNRLGTCYQSALEVTYPRCQSQTRLPEFRGQFRGEGVGSTKNAS